MIANQDRELAYEQAKFRLALATTPKAREAALRTIAHLETPRDRWLAHRAMREVPVSSPEEIDALARMGTPARPR